MKKREAMRRAIAYGICNLIITFSLLNFFPTDKAIIKLAYGIVGFLIGVPLGEFLLSMDLSRTKAYFDSEAFWVTFSITFSAIFALGLVILWGFCTQSFIGPPIMMGLLGLSVATFEDLNPQPWIVMVGLIPFSVVTGVLIPKLHSTFLCRCSISFLLLSIIVAYLHLFFLRQIVKYKIRKGLIFQESIFQMNTERIKDLRTYYKMFYRILYWSITGLTFFIVFIIFGSSNTGKLILGGSTLLAIITMLTILTLVSLSLYGAIWLLRKIRKGFFTVDDLLDKMDSTKK